MHSLFSSAIALLLTGAVCHSAHAALGDELSEVTRLHHAGQTASALERADRYLTAQPKDAQMRFLKSVVLADTGRTREAQGMLQQLAQDYPELAEPHNNLAAIYAAAGDYDKARTELEETLRLNPNYAPAQENLGDVHVMLAGQSYAKALRMEPSSASLSKKITLVRQLLPSDGERAQSAPGTTAAPPPTARR